MLAARSHQMAGRKCCLETVVEGYWREMISEAIWIEHVLWKVNNMIVSLFVSLCDGELRRVAKQRFLGNAKVGSQLEEQLKFVRTRKPGRVKTSVVPRLRAAQQK